MPYDARTWMASSSVRRPRNRYTPWVIGFSFVVSTTVAVIALLSPARHATNIILCFTLPIASCAASPFAREAWLTQAGRATYDEFERDALRRATQRAYGVLLLLLVLLFGGLWIAGFTGQHLASEPATWATLGLALTGIGAALPVLFAELLVPFPPVDDPEEDDL